jgi:hypothetical protein
MATRTTKSSSASLGAADQNATVFATVFDDGTLTGGTACSGSSSERANGRCVAVNTIGEDGGWISIWPI